MTFTIEYHGEEELSISGTVFGCTISRTIFGTIADAINIAQGMEAWFEGLNKVDIVSAETGEVYVTVKRKD